MASATVTGLTGPASPPPQSGTTTTTHGIGLDCGMFYRYSEEESDCGFRQAARGKTGHVLTYTKTVDVNLRGDGQPGGPSGSGVGGIGALGSDDGFEDSAMGTVPTEGAALGRR